MRDLKLEMEARGRIGDTMRTMSERASRYTILGFLSVDKVTCPLSKQIQFVDSSNTVANVNKKENSLQYKCRSYIWTKKWHQLRDCTIKTICFHCNGQYQLNICEKESYNGKTNNSKKRNNSKGIKWYNKQTQQTDKTRYVTNTLTSDINICLL